MGKEKIRSKHGVLTAVYKLGKYERVNIEEVKVLINGSVSGLAPVTLVTKKRSCMLQIQQQGWVPMTAYQGEALTDKAIIAFLKYTMRIAYNCERYGLRIDNLCWDPEKVFVDSGGTVHMIYWPVTTLNPNGDTALIFYRNFCGLMQSCGTFEPGIVQRYTAYFYQRQYLDFPVFRQFLLELIEQWQQAEEQRRKRKGEKQPQGGDGLAQSWYFGWLERPGTEQKFHLNADCVSIGRDGNQCQLHLKGCIAVGRQHAQIIFQGGQYYLLDKGSRNGTWVDDVRLVPEQSWPLADGAHIKFADQEFIFREEPGNKTIPIHMMKRGI